MPRPPHGAYGGAGPELPLLVVRPSGFNPRVKANRLEAFSDGVIAIIITIMVLDLKVPATATAMALWKVWPVFLGYALSFVIVAIYWVNHHHLIHLAGQVDAPMLWANMNLLFWMSLIPFVTAFLGNSHGAPLAVGLYDLVAMACAISFLGLRHAIARHHRRDPDLANLHRRLARKNHVAILIYVAAVAAAFVSVPLSLALVILPAAMYFVPERSVERRAHE